MTKHEIAGRLETLGARMLSLTGLPPTCETFRGLCHLAGELRAEHAEESDPPAAAISPDFMDLLTTLMAEAEVDESPLEVAERLVEGCRDLAATRAENDSLRAELSAATEGRPVAGHEHAFRTGGKCRVCGAEYSAGPMAVADPQPDYARIAMALDRAIPLLYQDGLSLYEGVREARRMLGTLQDEIVHRHCIDRSDESHPTDFADLIASVREHEPDPGAKLVPNPGQEAAVLDDLLELVREQRLVAQDQYEFASRRCADLESRVAELERHVQSMRRDAARSGPTPANGAYPA